MANTKKVTELTQVSNVANDDQFLVIDVSTTGGDDASITGKTSRVSFSDLTTHLTANLPTLFKHQKVMVKVHTVPKR